LILHGRYTCTARSPKCGACPVAPVCKYYARLQKLPPPVDGLDPKQGKYYCKTRGHSFDEPDYHTDRYGAEQASCPICGSMNVYDARTGRTTKRVPDFRV
jgi:endonuclease-3